MTTKDLLAIQLSTISSGSLISWNGSTITSIPSANVGTSFAAGTGLTLVGNQFSIDNSVVASLSGSIFTGPVRFNQGLSGSLTRLTDGTSYLIEGTNITVTSASNGAITISSPVEIFKAAKSLDENRTGDTVTSDTDLAITLSETGLYTLDSDIHFTANLNIGIKYRYFLTSGNGDVFWHSAFNAPFTITTGVNTGNFNSDSTRRGFSTRGIIEITSAPAVLHFQWSQNNNNLSPLTLHKGSWMTVSKTS